MQQYKLVFLTCENLIMKYRHLFFLLLLTVICSCKNEKDVQRESEISDTLKQNSTRIISKIGESLTPKAKSVLGEWREYSSVDEFMRQYYSISVQDALSNARELSELVGQMKDSIRVENLKEYNVKARFNVLHNETLRLADMAEIPSISDEEVKEEVLKILDVYSAVKAKINTIFKAEDIQNSLEVDTEIPIEVEDDLQPRAIQQEKGIL
jgi:hypothetical protein